MKKYKNLKLIDDCAIGHCGKFSNDGIEWTRDRLLQKIEKNTPERAFHTSNHCYKYCKIVTFTTSKEDQRFLEFLALNYPNTSPKECLEALEKANEEKFEDLWYPRGNAFKRTQSADQNLIVLSERIEVVPC